MLKRVGGHDSALTAGYREDMRTSESLHTRSTAFRARHSMPPLGFRVQVLDKLKSSRIWADHLPRANAWSTLGEIERGRGTSRLRTRRFPVEEINYVDCFWKVIPNGGIGIRRMNIIYTSLEPPSPREPRTEEAPTITWGFLLCIAPL